MTRKEQIDSIIERGSSQRDTRHLASLKYALESLLLGEHEECIDKIWIFGSFARGDYGEDSDVDILVLCNDKFQPRDGREMRSLAMGGCVENPEVDLKFLTYNSRWLDGVFAENLRRDAVLLWERI